MQELVIHAHNRKSKLWTSGHYVFYRVTSEILLVYTTFMLHGTFSVLPRNQIRLVGPVMFEFINDNSVYQNQLFRYLYSFFFQNCICCYRDTLLHQHTIIVFVCNIQF